MLTSLLGVLSREMVGALLAENDVLRGAGDTYIALGVVGVVVLFFLIRNLLRP